MRLIHFLQFIVHILHNNLLGLFHKRNNLNLISKNQILILGLLLFGVHVSYSQTVPGTYHSSWIGNTYGGKNSSTGSAAPSDSSDKWIQDYIDCLLVTEDGTCYTSSVWDEGHREHGIYKNGNVLGNKTMDMNCETAGGFTISGTNITGNGKTITDAGKPTAIAMGRGIYANKLLVADNGARKQVLVYDVSGAPTIVETLGVSGGIVADYTPEYEFPAAINAPAYPVKSYPPGYYHPFKLWGLTGVGCDTSGRIFVSTSEMGSAIRCFKKVESNWILDWRVENYFFVDNVYYDEKTDAAEIYGIQEHFRLDFSKKQAGKEWSIVGYTLDSYNYPEDPRGIEDVKANGEHGLTALIARVVNGTRYLWVGGMTCQPPKIFKFKPNTDIAVPCGMFMGRDTRIYDFPLTFWWPPKRPSTNVSGTFFWSDLNNDGKYQSNEYTMQKYDFSSGDFFVDTLGNIWQGGNNLRIWKPSFDINGTISYSDKSVEEITVEGLQNIGKIVFQHDFDRVVILSSSCRDIDGGKMYIVDNWSKGNRLARFVANLKGTHMSSWNVAGNYAFEVGWESRAKVYVTDLITGNLVGTMEPDASCGGVGRTGWVDISMGVQAYQRKSSSEYLVFVEDDYLSRVILYRWCPTGDCEETDMRVNITSPEIGKVYLNYQPIRLSAEVKKDTSEISKVEFFVNDSLVGESNSAPYQFDWNNSLTGNHKIYAKATSITGKIAFSASRELKVSDGTPEIIFNLSNIYYNMSDSVVLSAIAKDYDGTIESVQFFANDSLLYKDVDSAYIFIWKKFPQGIWNIQAKAIDNNGTTVKTNIFPIMASGLGVMDNKDANWIWTSGFSLDICNTCFRGSAHSSNLNGAYGQCTFTGNQLDAYCETWDGAGEVEIFIDGISKGVFSQNVKPYGGAKKFASISGLASTKHTAKFVSVSNSWVGIDYIEYNTTTANQGILTATVTPKKTLVNLSDQSADWKHFYDNDHKLSGSKINSISDFSLIGGETVKYANDLNVISWTDGTPTAKSSKNKNGIKTSGIGNGFSIDVNANNDTDTVNVYVSGYNVGAALAVHLSNNSSADYLNVVENTSGQWNLYYSIIYNAKQDNQKLNISWYQTNGNGYVGIVAAKMFGANIPVTIVDLNDKSQEVSIYPNPAKTVATIDFNTSIDANEALVEVLDVLGKKVYGSGVLKQISKLQLNTTEFKKGIYIVKITNDGSVFNKKLVIE